MVLARATNRNDNSVEGAIRATRIFPRSVVRWVGLATLLLVVFSFATPFVQAGCSAGQSSSGAFRSVEATQTPPGELTLKLYLRYEGGRFWFTTKPPAPACSGPECNSDSKMKTAPALEFQVRSTAFTMAYHSEKTYSSESDFSAEVPCESQHARRGFIEVVEPPPKRV